MLIIRVGIASERSFGGGASGTNQGTWAAAVASERAGLRRRQDSSYALKDLKVEITQVVEHDGEYGSDLAASEPDADVKRAGPLDVDGDLDVEAGAFRQQGKAADRSFAV